MSPRKPKQPPAPPPPEPAKLVQDGFSTYPTPDPAGRFFHGLPGGPVVGNGDAAVYRFRITVERIEEPADVVLARMVKLYLATTNHHHHETLAGEARKRFGVSLWELAQQKKAAST